MSIRVMAMAHVLKTIVTVPDSICSQIYEYVNNDIKCCPRFYTMRGVSRVSAVRYALADLYIHIEASVLW